MAATHARAVNLPKSSVTIPGQKAGVGAHHASLAGKAIAMLLAVAFLSSCEFNDYTAQNRAGNYVHERNMQLGGTRSATRSDGSGYVNDYRTSFRDFTNMVTALFAAWAAGDLGKVQEINKQLATKGATQAQIAKLNAQAATEALKINAGKETLGKAIQAAPDKITNIPLTALP